MAWDKGFEAALNPKAIAIVGVSSKRSDWGAYGFIGCFERLHFEGRIYPVNPKATEIQGRKTYPNLVSIPEHVDLVIVSVPAPVVPGVLEDCIAAGAKNVHIFTAGFEETGEAEGKELGEKVKEIARRGGLRVIGPNCMGLYVPAARISTLFESLAESGPVAFISQSGTLVGNYNRYAGAFGFRFSKVFSFGNAYVLDSTDFLEYLADDPETEVICMYLEGVKDGRRLVKLVREINRTKPVILWKGGLTDYGAQAVASHTGSLAGADAVWDAFFKQTGATRAGSLEELSDVTQGFLHIGRPPGRRVAVVGGGGGSSVATADACAQEGLEVPRLTPETRRQLGEFITLAGNSINNPLDIWGVLYDANSLQRVLKLVAADPLIDVVIVEYNPDMFEGLKRGQWQKLTQCLLDFSHENRTKKPMMVISRSWGDDSKVEAQQRKFQIRLTEGGVAVYPTLARGSRALAKLIQYYEFQDRASS